MTVVPDEQTSAAVVKARKGRRRWIIAIAVTAVYLVVGVVEVRLFFVPTSDRPGPTDAVVVLGGPTYLTRLHAADRLIADNSPGAVEAVSTPNGLPCPTYHAPQASALICFSPDPSTTQGEARAVAKLAAQYGWTSITVVTTADQVWRARLRFSRCWSGDLRVVQAPTTIVTRLLSAPYETAATIKAEVFQRRC
jgi:hypothetical protein